MKGADFEFMRQLLTASRLEMPALRSGARRLVSEGFLLHGSNRLVASLEPRQANDAAKEAGNYKAVYATTNIEVALASAIVDRAGLLAQLKSYTFGYRCYDDQIVFMASDNLYDLIDEASATSFVDGYLYLVDARLFEAVDGSPVERYTATSVSPAAVLPVSNRLATSLIRTGPPSRANVFRYPSGASKLV